MEKNLNSSESGGLEDETQIQRWLMLEVILGQLLKGKTLKYIKAGFWGFFCSMLIKFIEDLTYWLTELGSRKIWLEQYVHEI